MSDFRYEIMEEHWPATDHPLWSQSIYFNAYDPVADAGCFIRFGFMENRKSCNSWFVVFEKGKPLFQRFNATLPYTGDRMAGGVEMGGLNICMIEPLTKARAWMNELGFTLDLTWEAIQPMMDSIAFTSGGAGSFASEIANAHLEGSCTVRGHITLRDGRRIAFDGKGARDLAAGPRDWDKLRHYRLTMPIFDDGLTIIVIHGIAEGGQDAYMKMLHDGQDWCRIGEVEDHLDFGDDEMTVRSTRWRVVTDDGRSWTIEGELLFRAFLPADTFMLGEHMMRFTRDDGAVGYGLVECGYRFPWSGNGSKK